MAAQLFRPISRRTFLRGAGVSLALPFLDSMLPHVMGDAASAPPRRMICICTSLGLHAPYFFPKGAGRDYQPSPYIEVMKDHRDDFTVISGLAQQGNESAGHNSEMTFLTGARDPQLPGFHNGISIDQVVADKFDVATRFPSIILAINGQGLSWNRSGVRLPAEEKPSKLFARLFLEGTPDEVNREVERLNEGRSILDAVSAEATSIRGRIGAGDRDKLDEYFTSVREMERRLQAMQAWSRKPKPKVDAAIPHDVQNEADMIGKMDALFDLMPLALQTDSTRVFSFNIGGDDYVQPIPGVTMGHHSLSHHGQEPAKIEQLRRIEEAEMKSFAGLLTRLKAAKEADVPLLMNTTVLFGSNLGNASSHANNNLPIVLAGGPFKHGQHLVAAEGEEFRTNKPLCNLFVPILQGVGVETDKFATSTGTLTGLEMLKA